MIELADGFDRLLQLMVIVQPLPYLGDPLRTHADLSRTPSGIAHRQHRDRMTFAARAFRAATGMTNDSIQQRAPQKLAGDGQAIDQLLPRSKDSVPNRVYE